ncbi:MULTISPECIES: Ig-like domain-containing protein [Haloarcula]|uniref:Ig-like domain-containing protein n=1 Tax=Haloarcula TaxID=2237 RepID=UPI0023EE260C|nr:Ig-like domain-containing protein [Halomicroarcula sp. XH51]
MFGLLISMLALIQVNAVPAENQQVEFEHNKRVQQDMLNLERTILQSGTEDVPGSAQLELAARYPSRFFLINPGVGAGTIETRGAGTVTVSNARAPSADTYWNGDDRTFETTTLRYRPAYNEYGNAPVTVYEHNTLVNTFEGGAGLPVSSGSFIEGDQVTLVLLDGQLSTASTQSVAIETVPLSAPTTSTTITNDGSGDIVIELPTTLTEEQWETLLEDERSPNGNVANIDVTPGDPYNTLTVNLEPGEYQLRIARVGVGSDVDDSVLGARYLTGDGDVTESIRTGESTELAVEVRDRYNNPATGEVTFSTSDGTFLPSGGTSVTERSDEDGAASVVFSPSSAGTSVVTAEGDFDGSGTIEPRERTTFTITVGGGSGGEDSVSEINPGTPGSVSLESVERKNTGTVEVTLANTGTQDQKITRARLLFYSSNSNKANQDSAVLNGNDADTLYLFGDWDTVDSDIVVPAGGEQTITLTFDKVGTKDFFGFSIEYSGTSANYFVQLP